MTTPRTSLPRTRGTPLVILAALLALGGCAYLAKGFYVAWRGGDQDLQTRQQEWRDFERGVYPSHRLPISDKPRATAHTVYPPYALPMFAVFFGAGRFEVARVVLQALSLAALLAMMGQGTRLLGRAGWQAGLLGAALAPAISGNCTAIALGQFSILCMGLISLQVLMLERNRPLLAGLFWALAMIKPQIALPFALLFLLERRWRGLLAGCGLLGALSGLALGWTGISPLELLQSGATEKLSFVKEARYSPFWISAFRITPRAATAGGLGIIALLAGILTLRDWRGKIPMLSAAGICAMLGFVLFYHRHYDNMMVYPLLLAMVWRVISCGWQHVDLAVTSLLALTLYLPASTVVHSAALTNLVFLLPIAASLLLMRRPVTQFGQAPLKPVPPAALPAPIDSDS